MEPSGSPPGGRSSGLRRYQRVLCAVSIALAAAPLSAQKTKYTPGFGAAGNPPANVVRSATPDAAAVVAEESCFPWNLAMARAATVSVGTLHVPLDARREFEKACDASNKNRFAEAELHARGAIDKFRNYAAGWVMLGVILEEQHKSAEAREACSRAVVVDAAYLPAHLCAAEMAVRNRAWQDALNAADLALSVNPDGDPYARYYRAMAFLHLGRTAEAEKEALRAAEIDVTGREPSLHFLLAEIYEREGDRANALAQLREFLKRPTGRQQEDRARELLAKLESPPPAK